MSLNDYRGWDIIINDINLSTLTVPKTIYLSNYGEGPEYFDFSYYSGPASSATNWLSDGIVLGEQSFIITITSKTNDVLEGTFSGTVRNGSDMNATKTITEGKFKIKLYRI